MNFISPIPRAKQPFYHPGSSLRSPLDSDAVNQLWKKNQKDSFAAYNLAKTISKMQLDVDRMKRRILGGGTTQAESWPPTNYDMNVSYSQGDWAWVSPNNSAYTTGSTNPDGSHSQSMPGLYRALQDVAPYSNNANVNATFFHLPLASLPDQNDITDTTDYWMYFGYYPCDV